jgi:predicted mannosyl-3-phosphoglycerate phosphatase (HAD superfamily)
MEGAQTGLIRFCRRVSQDGFSVMKGGRFHHLVRDTDKGRAVDILLALLRQRVPKLLCAAIGDSPNDIPMLRAADIPILVQRHDGAYDAEVRCRVPNLRLAPGIGPEGWRAAIEELLDHWLAEADGVEDVSDAPEHRC